MAIEMEGERESDRKTRLKKPNCGDGIISINPRLMIEESL